MLAEALGFSLQREEGSHRVYAHPALERPLPIQLDGNGAAKAYQVRQFLKQVDRHGLQLEDEEE